MPTQQYTDYISQFNAQKERQAQLVQKYNQEPKMPYNRFIWASTTVEKHRVHGIQPSDVVKAIIAVLGAGLFLVLSILLG